MNERPTAPMPRKSPCRGSFLPKSRISQNDSAGRAKMIHAWVSTAALSLHQVDLGEVDRAAVAVDEKHDGQPDADLGGRDGDDEQGEDLTGRRVVEGPEGDEVDVDRVQDELDRHQHQHAVL